MSEPTPEALGIPCRHHSQCKPSFVYCCTCEAIARAIDAHTAAAVEAETLRCAEKARWKARTASVIFDYADGMADEASNRIAAAIRARGESDE